MKFQFNPIYQDANESQKWEQIRLWRNDELATTDWTQIADSTADKIAWAKYRQALRDLPANWSKAEDVELPDRPA